MRKITLFFAALLISMTAFAVNITDGTKLYLKPNANWNADGARFAAYFFGGDGELWVSMTDTDNDGVYEVTCSGTRGNVIFCRMNGGNSTNGWNNKWNQTADLTWDGTKNQYNVPDGAWDGSNNDYWVEVGNNTEVEVPTTWTIAGTIPCLGAEWATDKTENDLVEGENGVWTKTYTGVTLEAGTYEYKVTKNHMWGEAYPNDNAKLVIAADGKYDVTFTFDATSKAVNATAEKLCVKASWSFDGGKTAAESGNLVLDKFTNVIVAFSGIDSVGREVTSVAGQGSSTNILFYEVLEDGSLTPVEGNGLMYPKSSGKTVTYSLQAKNYKAVETGTYNYLKQGNYRIVLDGDAGVAGTGDILFKPNRSGLPKVYNEEVFTFDFKIENDYVARYAQSTNFEVTPAYDRFAAPTLLESLSEIIVKFTDYESVTVNATYGDNQTYIPCVVSENGANVEKAQVKWEAVEGTPNALRLYIDEAVTAMGTYGITIPEGLVTFKKTAAEEAYNEAISLSYTVAQKNITEGLKLYYDFSAVESLKALTYANAVLNNGEQEVAVELANISEGLWELTVPAGTYFHATINLGTSAGGLSFGAAFLYYDGTNNLYTLKADAPYVQYGMAELGDFTLSVYPTEPEVVATIVGGTKLYLKSDLGVSSSSAYGYNVVFGEFEVPSSGGSGGSVRPMQQAGSLGGTTTIPGTAMTKVYTKEGKYDIWEVVAPEGTADSIFNIVVSRKGTMISGYITPLKYDGEHNMFMLPENFAFNLKTPIADETAGEWGIYVEGEYSDPDPIVGTWNIEEGAVLESFESATITFTGVEKATTTSMYPICFYRVAEDGTATLVENNCTAGLLNRTASGAAITLKVQEDEYDVCYDGKLTSGNYRIVLSAGMVKFNNDNANKNTEDYVLNFTLESNEVVLPEIDAVYTATPEASTTVSEIREIVLQFTEAITLAELDLVQGTNIPSVSMYDETFGQYVFGGYMFFEAVSGSTNSLRLYVPSEYMGGMEAFTTEGEYKITIPAGVVTFGEAGVNKEIVLNYTVAEPAPAITASWNIEEGAVLESFESATITFTGVESAAAKSSYTNYFFYKVAEDGTETLVPSMCSDGYMDAAAEGTSVTFSIDKETCYLDAPQYGAYFALTSGDYRIKVPAGAIKFNGDATNLNTEAYVLNFSLNVPATAEPVEAVYTVDPENNSTVAEIREIVLTFTEYETITVAEPDLMMGSNIPTVSMGNEGMFMPSGMFMMFAAGETANTLKLYVDPQYAGGMEAFTTEGEYKIVIPEGVVTFGEAGLNKTIELNYTVEEPQPIEVTITGKVKRAVQTGTASIVLTHEEDGTAHIYSVDNETLAITELSQEGVIARDAENAGDYLALSDIALTTDGKLVACNYVQTQHNADNVKDGYKRGMANFYIWNDLAGAPSIWFQSKAASNSLTSDQGYTMAVQGTSTDAQILVSGLRAEGSMRYSLFTVVNGVYEDINQDAGKTTNDYYFYFGIIKDGANFKVSTHGEDYQFTASPLNSANFVYDGNLAEPSEISVPTSTTENPVVEGVIAEGTFGKNFNGVSYLTVDEQVLMAAPFANEEGLLEGVRVLDITKGFAEATMFETTALLETAVAVESAAVTFVEGTEGYVDLYLFAGSEIYTFEQKVEKEQQNPVDVENGELVVDVYSENGSVYVEVEAGVMVEAYTVDGLCIYSEVSKSATTVIEGLNTNMAIIRVNGVAYKVFVK